MNTFSSSSIPRHRFFAIAVFCLLLTHGPAQAGKTKINYVPGITLVPDVLLADDQTPRSYDTPQGPTLWKEGLPVQQGDKLKLNVFVATGGADLKEIKVRLDNAPIADITASPWNTTIDTAPLGTGSHMVEVWAQATGNPPQSNTKQLSFFLLKQLVKGVQIEQAGGHPVEVTPTGDTNTAPLLPGFLAGKQADADAILAIYSRVASLPSGSPTTAVGTDPMAIDAPTIFIVRPARNSTAKQYAYALARDGQTILTSNTAYSVSDPRQITAIKIQKRSDTTDGLRSGQVSLWVWGVDADGRPGDPQKVQLVIPE